MWNGGERRRTARSLRRRRLRGSGRRRRTRGFATRPLCDCVDASGPWVSKRLASEVSRAATVLNSVAAEFNTAATVLN